MHSLPSDQLADYDDSLSESQNAQAEQTQSLKLLLTSGNGSDLTITCGEHTFHVHSPIMCSRSDYFAIHRDASTRFQASDPHHVRLSQEDPHLVERMITFIYTSEYPNPTGEEIVGVFYDVDALALTVHAAMYGLGDFYGIRSLKWVAAGKFKELMQSWYPLVDKSLHSSKLLAFVQAIRIVYTTTPEHDRGLRDFVIDQLPSLFRGLLPLEEFKELADEVPVFKEEAFDERVVYKTALSDYVIGAKCELLETGQGADMTITCKGKIFKVHSAIVASRSDFFAAACWGSFKQEAENHCVDLPDDDPAVVEAMLQYLYTLSYTATGGPLHKCSNPVLGQEPSPQFLFDIAVYRMGDKYGIHGLKGMASEKFAATFKRLAKQPFSSISVQALAIVIRRVYDSTPESDNGLRRHVLGFAKQQLKHLLALEEFKTVLAEIPEFSYQLLVQEAEGRVEEAPPSKRKRWDDYWSDGEP